MNIKGQGHSLTLVYCSKLKLVFLRKQAKNLEPSYKTDLDLQDCLRRVKLVLLNFIGLMQLFVVILERGIPRLIAK